MRLLDRYLLRELLIPFAYCLAGFWVFWTAFELFSELQELQEKRVGILRVAQYYLVKTPEHLMLVLPIALLLALLYALSNHARHNELTAMRAAGQSLWRLALPYLAVGFLLSVASFALNELWVPDSADTAEAIIEQRDDQKNSPRKWEHHLGFANVRQNRTWFAEAYNPVNYIMLKPYVEWKLETGTLWQIWAERAAYRDGKWIFTNVQERIFPAIRGEFPTVVQTNLLVIDDFSETPEEIRSAIKIGKINDFKEAKRTQLSIREILSYKRLYVMDSAIRSRHNRGDTNRSREVEVADRRQEEAIRKAMSTMAMLDTKLHGRLAAPWTCLVVVLIALPFGALPGRRNVFVGVASSIVICFVYFVLMQLGLALGAGRHFPPWLAAWAPNLLFAAAGIWLTWKIR